MNVSPASIESLFGNRMQPASPDVLNSNLRHTIESHLLHHFAATSGLGRRLEEYRDRSGDTRSQICVSRPAGELVRAHGLSLAALVNFARDKTVVDIGPGQSDFLSCFKQSRRLGIEQNRDHTNFQAKRGNEVIYGLAEDALSGISNNTTAVVHDSYAAAYWSPSPDNAVRLAKEMKRITAVGGMILSGAVFDEAYHQYCENALRVSGTLGLPLIPPYTMGDRSQADGGLSYNRMVFYNELVSDPNFIAISTRTVNRASAQSPQQTSPDFQLPNYIAAIKITS